MLSSNQTNSQVVMAVSGASTVATVTTAKTIPVTTHVLWFDMFQTADLIALGSLIIFASSAIWNIHSSKKQHALKEKQYLLDKEQLKLELEKLKVESLNNPFPGSLIYAQRNTVPNDLEK